MYAVLQFHSARTDMLVHTFFLCMYVCMFISCGSSQYRSNWNMEDEVESAVRPTSGHDGFLHLYNGVNEHDSSSETSTYSENSSNTLVRFLYLLFTNFLFSVSVL